MSFNMSLANVKTVDSSCSSYGITCLHVRGFRFRVSNFGLQVHGSSGFGFRSQLRASHAQVAGYFLAVGRVWSPQQPAGLGFVGVWFGVLAAPEVAKHSTQAVGLLLLADVSGLGVDAGGKKPERSTRNNTLYTRGAPGIKYNHTDHMPLSRERNRVARTQTCHLLDTVKSCCSVWCVGIRVRVQFPTHAQKHKPSGSTRTPPQRERERAPSIVKLSLEKHFHLPRP
jgi:hypothetical protein